MNMEMAGVVAGVLSLPARQVTAAIELLDEGNTIPFIARYRQEKTGRLDEQQLRDIQAELGRQRTLAERRQTILTTIEAQGQLTPELRQALLAASDKTTLEDLYQPYKKKRQTRAGKAAALGLTPLAELILSQDRGRELPEQAARRFLTAEVPDVEAALAGARDIVAERIADQPEVRRQTREKALRYGTLSASKIKSAEDPKEQFALYYEFSQNVNRVRPHQTLALNRGETGGVLRVKVEVGERDWLLAIRSVFRPDRRSPWEEQLRLAAEDAAARLLLPAIERDVRRELTEQAEVHAIQVFADNLRGLLGQPPLAGRTVLGVDPAYRTGCKLAVVDPTGKLLATDTIYPHQPQRQEEKSLATLTRLCRQHNVSLIVIGNGTASRETEQLVAKLLQNWSAPGEKPQYLIVNEAGASVYSASELARAELPELDVTLRGAVSIARRAQDPLAELVKIDPQSIGVGLYQHDLNQKALGEALGGVVESVVNQVGVDVNTASAALLTYVAGIGPKLAENIVAHRDSAGRFATRGALYEVSGLGPKAFEQAAGFLRIREGESPFDSSAIHPESYAVAEAVLARARTGMDRPVTEREQALARLQSRTPLPELARQLDAGEPTLQDILEQLVRPGRDPRADAPPPILRSDVLQMADLRPGMILAGTVRNRVDFGAFVDIGVKQDGLLHRSQIPRYADPTVGDVLSVEILSVDSERGRISLGWVGDR